MRKTCGSQTRIHWPQPTHNRGDSCKPVTCWFSRTTNALVGQTWAQKPHKMQSSTCSGWIDGQSPWRHGGFSLGRCLDGVDLFHPANLTAVARWERKPGRRMKPAPGQDPAASARHAAVENRAQCVKYSSCSAPERWARNASSREAWSGSSAPTISIPAARYHCSTSRVISVNNLPLSAPDS